MALSSAAESALAATSEGITTGGGGAIAGTALALVLLVSTIGGTVL